MRQFLIAGIAGLSLAGATTVAALVAWPIGSDPRKIEPEGDVQRGAYLARASGCVACHTNFEEGGAALAGGAPLNTDFGTFYPPNLTTDPDHGLGNWDVEQFAKAIRQGIAPDGTPYYPAFTYPFYANFSDQDIADLWAAFQTVAPVAESTPEHDVGFPFDQRWGLKLWRAAFFGAPETAPVDGKSAEWNRGRELVRGAAHCAACHTGRNLAGGRVSLFRRQRRSSGWQQGAVHSSRDIGGKGLDRRQPELCSAKRDHAIRRRLWRQHGRGGAERDTIPDPS